MIEDCFCSCFSSAVDRSVKGDAHVISILSAIKNGKWKDLILEYREYLKTDKSMADKTKKLLPCVTFSGTFSEIRKQSNLSQYSRIVVIDIDKVPTKSLSFIKSRICMSKYVLSCFESPSFGLKVLLLSAKNETMHKKVFLEMQEYFKVHYNIEIDKSGKDISRLCFMSYDPEIYFNENAIEFGEWIKEIEDKDFDTLKTFNNNYEISTNSSFIFDICDKMVRKSSIGGYSKGNRNNFVYSLSCNLNRAGVNMDQSIGLINNKYSSLGFEEIKTTVKSAYKYNSHEFGSKPIIERNSRIKKLI